MSKAELLERQKVGVKPQRGAGGKFAPKPEGPATVQIAEPIPSIEVEDPAARYVDGLKVVETEPVYTGLKPKPGFPRIALKTIVTLVLADDSRVYGCVECDFANKARGEVMRHRAEAHGANLGGWGSRRKGEATVPPAALSITLGEVLGLSQNLQEYAMIIERQEVRIEELRERAEVAERRLRKIAFQVEKAGLRFASEEDA